MFPGWINGWNIMIAPPNGSNINNLLAESQQDKLASLSTISKNISSTIGIKSSFETTQTRIIKMVEINLILPSKLCIGLFFDAKSSNLIICVMSTIYFHYFNIKN